MSVLARLRSFLGTLLFRRRMEREMAEEWRFHLETRIDALLQAGRSPVEAHAEAHREFGDTLRWREEAREARGLRALDELRADVRDGARVLRRAPFFTAAVVLTLALGVGASTSIFALVNGILLAPLPYPAPERLVRIVERNAELGRLRSEASFGNFADWRGGVRDLQDLTAVTGTALTISGAGEPEQVVGMLVTPEFFTLLSPPLLLGEPFPAAAYHSLANAALGPRVPRSTPDEPATVILSHALWHRQFGGDPHVVGRQVRINGRAAVVTGVMAADFRFDETPWGRADCWLPVVESVFEGLRRLRVFVVVGRLAPDASHEEAAAEMEVMAARLARDHPENSGWSVGVEPLRDSIVEPVRRGLAILLGAVLCLVMIVCAGLANLFVLRAVDRSREMAIREALGAGRGRLLRQFLVQTTMLSVLGGGAGLLLAAWAVPILIAHAPHGLPRLREVAIDTHVLAFAALAAALVGVICGAIAAAAVLHGSRGSLLRTGLAVDTHARWPRLRQGLVVAQVALAVVLLTGAGLMVRTVGTLTSLELGFEPRNVLTFGVSLRAERYNRREAGLLFHEQLLQRLAALPSVEAAGVGGVPLVGRLTHPFEADGGDRVIETGLDVVSPGYFRALGIRLLDGRLFDRRDDRDARPVVVVSRAFARQAWGTDRAAGRRVREADPSAEWMEVVGVVEDVRTTSLEDELAPLVFVPHHQTRIAMFNNFAVRSTSEAERLLPFARAAVRDVDPDVALANVATMEERLARAIAPRRFNLWLLGIFSVVAFVMALLAVFALLCESVARRVPEIGIRMALGAARGNVARLVLGDGLRLVAAGLALGLLASLALNRVMGTLVFGVSTTDASTYLAVLGIWLVTAACAVSVPVVRAMRVEPLIAIRGD